MNPSPAPITLPPDPHALRRRIEHGGLTWLDFINPSKEQLHDLGAQYQFHPLHLEDVLSRIQRPKIDDNDEPEYLFIVLHLPVFDEMNRLSTISEVDIFVGAGYVITTHDTRFKPMLRLVQNAGDEKGQRLLMARGPGYLLYRIIETLVKACFPMIYRLDEKLDRLEEDMFKRDVRVMVEELSFLRRDIISLRRIIRPNMPVIRSLAARERHFLHVDEDVYFGDLDDSLARIWDMLEEQKEIIEGLDATLFSLTSHRMNQEMKTFTLISVIILPMTLVASILGMNVFIPLAEHPLALPAALLIMCALAWAMFAYFRYKHWV